MTEFDSVIPPGGVGKVTASVKTDHFKGPITKSVTVTSNDPDHPTVSLQLKADVKVAIDVQPSESVYLQGKLGELKATELKVTANDGQPFDILAIEKTVGNPEVSVKVAPPEEAAAAEPGKPPAKSPKTKAPRKGAEDAAAAGAPVASGSARYVVSIGPAPDWQAGRSSATVVLKTSHPKSPTITLYVNANIQGEVTVAPERVSLIARPVPPPQPGQAAPPPAAPQELVQHVKLSKPSGSALQIVSVDSTDPDVVTKLTTVSEGREFDLEVRYKGKPGRGMISGNITVTTNEPKQKTIVIPVFGRT